MLPTSGVTLNLIHNLSVCLPFMDKIEVITAPTWCGFSGLNELIPPKAPKNEHST
jgi:hypothetical protein